MPHTGAMGNDLRARIKLAAGSQVRWANATGQSVEHVSRVIAGKYQVPEWWLAMLELLEQTPPKDLPKRWGR